MKFPLKRAGNSIGLILGLMSLIICIFAPWATGISSADKSRVESNPLPGNDAAQKARVTNFNRAQIGETFNQLPLRFEQNAGQFLKPIQFFCRGKGYELALANNEVVVKLEKAKEREWKVSEEVVGDCERLKLPPSAFCLAPLSSKFLSSSQKQQTTSTEVVTGNDLVNSDHHSTPTSASSSVARATVKMQFIGSNPTAHIAGLDPLATRSNYFTGNNPKDWHTDVANFSSVKYENLYNGVDAIVYGNEQNVEYDFVVAPQVDASVIQLAFDGAKNVRIDEQGDLILETSAGQMRQHKPIAYQQVNGERKEIACNYALSSPATYLSKLKKHPQHPGASPSIVSFRIGEYDRNFPLVIDPVIDFSSLISSESFTGILGFEATGVALDADENIYILGHHVPIGVPKSNDLQAQDIPNIPNSFLAKIDSVHKQLVYFTYLAEMLPSISSQTGTAIAVDDTGNSYITGWATSSSFPTTQGAFQTSAQGQRAFITKLNAEGNTLIYSTFLGAPDTTGASTLPQCSDQSGSCFTRTYDIAIDAEGNAYVTGETNVRSFPTTPNAFKPVKSNADCISSPISPNPCLEAFVTKLNSTGTALVYSTFLGGNGYDSGNSIKVDTSGNAYIVGTTAAKDFPTQNALNPDFLGGTTDIFLSKLNPTGSALLYSTYLGGTENDTGNDIDVDTQGNVYLCGNTGSLDLPVTAGVLQSKPSNFSVYKTTDSDITWKPFAKGLPNNITVVEIAIDSANAANLLAGTSAGVYESTDAGESWKATFTKPTGFFIFLTFAPQNPSIAFASSYDSTRSIYTLLKSTDKGSTWNEISYPTFDAGSGHINDLQVDPTDLSTLYLNNNYFEDIRYSHSRILKTTDAGITWKYIDGGLPSQAHPRLLGINPQNPALLFAMAGNLNRSKNGGAKWKPTDVTDPDTFALDFNPVNPDVIYAGGNKLYNSTDSGLTWKQIDNNLTSFEKILITVNSLYAISSGKVFKSIDTGKTWTDSGSASGLKNIQTLAVDPKNPATLYAGAQHFGNDGFVMKLNSQGSAISYCTYLGGSASDSILSISVDIFGNTSVTGSTTSADFPTHDAIQPKFIYGQSSFVTKLNSTGAAIYSTYLSGNGSVKGTGIATDKSGRVYITGTAYADLFPQISPVQTIANRYNSFITRITDAPLAHPAPLVLSVSPDSGVAVTQTRVTIKGVNFLPGATVSIGDKLALNTIVVDANTIQTTAQEGAGGRVSIIVMNPDGQAGSLPQSFNLLLTPHIAQVSIVNNQLAIDDFSITDNGYGFDEGAVVLVNGKEVKIDPPFFRYRLKSKKALKKIQVGQTVRLQVRNGNGLLSNIFSFTQP